MEIIVKRGAGLDVHKAQVTACVRSGLDELTPGLLALAGEAASDDPEMRRVPRGFEPEPTPRPEGGR